MRRLMLSKCSLGLVVLLTMALNDSARAQTPTTQQVRDAIDALEKEPLKARDRGHTATIVQFAEDSPDVLVSLDPAFLPFVDPKKDDDEHSRLLLAAFIAGNVRAQLERKKVEDDTYSGLLMVFKVYHAIRAEDEDYRVPRLEELEAMEKEGKLKAYIEQRTKERERRP